MACDSAVAYTDGQTATVTGITVVASGDDFIVTGTSPANTIYENSQFKIPCLLSDSSKTKTEYPYFKYNENLNPTVGDQSNLIPVERKGIPLVLDLGTTCSDPEGLPLTNSL